MYALNNQSKVGKETYFEQLRNATPNMKPHMFFLYAYTKAESELIHRNQCHVTHETINCCKCDDMIGLFFEVTVIMVNSMEV